MKEITREQIDEIVNNIFISNADDIAMQYAENLSNYLDILKNENDNTKQSAVYFAAIKTAQDNCVSILKESLKELLCD